jgi:formate hydrogenlyase subunit 6/NADH:ubiquinone oxidoreductase subunit I
MLFSKKLYQPHFKLISWAIMLLTRYQIKKIPQSLRRTYDSHHQRGGIPMLITDKGQHLCNGCDLCPKICPTQCLDLHVKDKKPQALNLDWSRCTQCGLCWEICPTNALAPDSQIMLHSIDGKPKNTKINLISLSKKK